MEIKINTKFNIGQKVYICCEDTCFKEGYFQRIFVPDTEPKIIDKIMITQGIDSFNIYYSLKGNIMSYHENKLFETLEEAKKSCDNNE